MRTAQSAAPPPLQGYDVNRSPDRTPLSAWLVALSSAGLAVLAGGARADDAPAAPASTAAPAWEGALGLMLNHGPTYQGSADSRTRLVPGFFLRYGRFSATNAGGFVTKRNDDVERGVSAELLRRDDLRVNLSARFDGGRDAGSDPALDGLPDVRPTLRLRLAAVKRFAHGWQLTGSVSPDVVGRGGGTVAEAGLGREWRLSPTLRATMGTTTTWADSRYLRSYFGITPAQSALTNLAVAEQSSGLRDVSASAALYAVFGPHWVGFASLNATHLLGGAARSPLTHRVNTWSAYSGLAWRF